jgi:uncharacterized protein (TIGR03032 family)
MATDVAGDGFVAFFSGLDGSLALTTYESNRLIILGWDGKQLIMLPHKFDTPMGLAVDGQRLAVATRKDIRVFANAAGPARGDGEPEYGRYDGLYLPRASFYTGEVLAHDLAFGKDRLWFVNTRFNCLAAVSQDFSFVPCWRPPFITELVPEDRCHLNGVAMVDGQPKFATALGESDGVNGWRPNKATGGVVLDVQSGATILNGLSMPHSPRWHEDKLWVLNSGLGELWRVDPKSGRHDVICALPGYVRGLCLIGDYALVALSQIRDKHRFGGLPVQERFPRPQCGVALVDIRRGQQVGFLGLPDPVRELFDIQLLPRMRRPTIVNPEQELPAQPFTTPEFTFCLRPGERQARQPTASVDSGQESGVRGDLDIGPIGCIGPIS